MQSAIAQERGAALTVPAVGNLSVIGELRSTINAHGFARPSPIPNSFRIKSVTSSGNSKV